MSEEAVVLRQRHSTSNFRSYVDEHHVEEARRENPEEIIDRKNFLLKSAITSIWLPCVVGDTPFIFLVSAIASLTNKILLFIVAVVLKHYNVIETNAFLLWCIPEEDGCGGNHTNHASHLTICRSLASCFDGSIDQNLDNSLVQKIRLIFDLITQNHSMRRSLTFASFSLLMQFLSAVFLKFI